MLLQIPYILDQLKINITSQKLKSWFVYNLISHVIYSFPFFSPLIVFIFQSQPKHLCFTLCPDEDERYFLHVPELGHLDVVVVDGAEAGLVFQAEHENDGVHPTGKLQWKRGTHLDH